MNLGYLKEFIYLADTLSYQDTADAMHMSSSALSKHIMKLEDSLGVSLFDRTTRTVKLTKYGEILKDYAKQVVSTMDRCLYQLENQKDTDAFSLRVGYLPIFESYSLPEIVAEFARKHPYIDITMNVINGPINEVDFSLYDYLFLDEVPTGSMENRLLIDDRLTLLVPKNHRLERHSAVRISDLRDDGFIVHGRDAKTLCREYMMFEDECSKNSFKPNNLFYSSNTATILKLVRNNIGISVMNANAIPYYIKNSVTVVPLECDISTKLYCVKTSSDKENDYSIFKDFVAKSFFQLMSHDEIIA